MTKLIVDGVEVDVPGEMNLLQACEIAGAEIPRFCFHERLSVAGNCRMCLVEVKGAPKPVASCAQQVRDQRPGPNGEPAVVLTKSPLVRKAREGVMEFLLANHPLDCPICDQGGECDLQDQAMAFGRAGSRFDENKRAVEDKNMGPLVATVMTRCIQCTRCVRFAAEVAGMPEIGATGRGEDMEITTYLEAAIDSELSGNLVDLCPVGALTSKPYKFNARPWELRKTETIDVMDGMGSAIRVDVRGTSVLRILPRINDDVNEEWISDKTRYVWDGLARQRLDQPWIRCNKRLEPASWADALALAKARLSDNPAQIGAIAGGLANVEGMKALGDLLDALNIANRDCRELGEALQAEPRAGYLFNTSFAGAEEADALLLIGCNPREEASVFNARLRKSWLRGTLQHVGLIGPQVELHYPTTYLGHGAEALSDLANGIGEFYNTLKAAKKPMLILGAHVLGREDGAQILHLAGRIAAQTGMVRLADVEQPGWNGFNVLHANAARVGGLDLGFVPQNGGLSTRQMIEAAQAGALKTLILLHADEVPTHELGACFVVYIGSHGDRGAARADLILPSAAYVEQNALWVNSEGRVQEGRRAAFPKGGAREDWAIFRALSGLFDKPLPYDDLAQLREHLRRAKPVFLTLNHAAGPNLATPFNPEALGETGDISAEPFAPAFADYHLTNPIARASKIMAECAALRRVTSMAAE